MAAPLGMTGGPDRVVRVTICILLDLPDPLHTLGLDIKGMGFFFLSFFFFLTS